MSDGGPSASHLRPEIGHCVDKIRQLVEAGRDDRRVILQVGYNLGRLSELTGLGREPFWDAWKDAVARWDLSELRKLARDLHQSIGGRQPVEGETPVAPETSPS